MFRFGEIRELTTLSKKDIIRDQLAFLYKPCLYHYFDFRETCCRNTIGYFHTLTGANLLVRHSHGFFARYYRFGKRTKQSSSGSQHFYSYLFTPIRHCLCVLSQRKDCFTDAWEPKRPPRSANSRVYKLYPGNSFFENALWRPPYFQPLHAGYHVTVVCHCHYYTLLENQYARCGYVWNDDHIGAVETIFAYKWVW